MLHTGTGRTRVEVRHDTLYHNSIQKDSAYFRDSIYVFNNGTTIIYKEYHNTYRLSGKTDTIYRLCQDTVKVKDTVIQYKEKEESWWSKTVKRIGIAAIVLLLLVFIAKGKAISL